VIAWLAQNHHTAENTLAFGALFFTIVLTFILLVISRNIYRLYSHLERS
jgi:hypothetical protein